MCASSVLPKELEKAGCAARGGQHARRAGPESPAGRGVQEAPRVRDDRGTRQGATLGGEGGAGGLGFSAIALREGASRGSRAKQKATGGQPSRTACCADIFR